jgi:hypothetical protein
MKKEIGIEIIKIIALIVLIYFLVGFIQNQDTIQTQILQ